MPYSLSSTGITIALQPELIAWLTSQYQAIYGTSINLASATPDAQMMNIFIQGMLDLSELLVSINASFDPGQATGVLLDQRVAINGIQRQAATFTVTPITVTTNQAVNLYGLDQTAQPVFTVQDAAGNQWQLQTTQIGVPVGANVFNFQAALAGAVLTTLNTIQTPVTIVLGVTSVNNPTTYSVLGQNQETDAALRTRRANSVSLASQGYLSGLLASLLNVSGVTSAIISENLTSANDNQYPDAAYPNGTPGHSIWVIVGGSGSAANIAQAIYGKRNAGCGMRGETSFNITQADGSLFTVLWDTVVTQNLFIAFTATSINGIVQPNVAAILAQLPGLITPGVFTEVNVNEIATLVQQIDPNTLVTSCGVSTGLTQIATLSGVAASGTFKVAYNGNSSAAINWNDSTPTIQTKIQAVAGLSGCTVTGSIATQTLTFTLNVTSALGLLSVNTNSLQTGGSVPITFSFNEGYQNILVPSSKRYQFNIGSSNIIILAIQMSPASATVVHGNSQQFTAAGGYGTLTWALTTNNSGGNVNSGGLYTAGATRPSTDVITVTDLFGNTATATVTVS